MHQRVAMDAFERRGSGKGRLLSDAKKLGAVENQKRPKSLAAGQNRMA